MPELGSVPTNAADVAEQYGLSDMAKNGLGYAWQQNFVRSALGRDFDYGGMMDRGGMSLVNQGLLHSGAMDATLPAEVAGIGQGIASDAYTQAIGHSDQVAQNAQQTEFSLGLHEDRMTLERDIAQAQLDAQEQNWWDYVIQGSSVAANLVSAGSGVGIFT